VEQFFATTDSPQRRRIELCQTEPDFFQLAENGAKSGGSLLSPIQNHGINILSPPTRSYFGTPSVRLNSRLLREMRALARQRPRFGAERIHDLLVKRHWRVNASKSIAFGNERTCKSRKSSIESGVFLVAVRIAVSVTALNTRTTSGRTTL
jgi:hypothetical protein